MAFPYSAPSVAATAAEELGHLRSASRSPTSVSDASTSSNLFSGSPVSWAAISAGAAVASSLSLILLILGTGLGLSSVSPWASAGMGAAAFGVSTILWLTCTQLVASGMGGYLAGRLRTKYVAVHSDEVYFRDTAHGFLTWALATLITASVLASAVGTVVGAGASVAGGVASATASTAAAVGGAAATSALSSNKSLTSASTTSSGGGIASEPIDYLLESMFRKSGSGVPSAAGSTVDGSSTSSTAEIARVFMNGMKAGALPPEDAKYVAASVATRTGLTPDEAEARVKSTFERMQIKARDAEASAKQAADTARKATAYAALWLFVSLLIGAFFASWGATLGGRHRDN
jgi:hypothetical protein